MQRVHDRPARRPPDRLDAQPRRHGGGSRDPSRCRHGGVAGGLRGPAGAGLGGTVKRGERDMPAVLAASIVSLELLVHGWDFAVATGQQVTVSDEVSRYVLDLAYEVISPQARQRGSLAGAVEVGPDADILERLIAFSGRTAA